MTGVRMDKWLWAARFFKTRSLAARACDLGRIESNGQAAKPAREGRAGGRFVQRGRGGRGGMRSRKDRVQRASAQAGARGTGGRPVAGEERQRRFSGRGAGGQRDARSGGGGPDALP